MKSAEGDLAAVIVTAFKPRLRRRPGDDRSARSRRRASLCDEHDAALICDDVRAGFRLDLRGSWDAAGRRARPLRLQQGDRQRLCAGRGGRRRPLPRRGDQQVYVTGSFWFGAISMAAAVATLEKLRGDRVIERWRRWVSGCATDWPAGAAARSLAAPDRAGPDADDAVRGRSRIRARQPFCTRRSSAASISIPGTTCFSPPPRLRAHRPGAGSDRRRAESRRTLQNITTRSHCGATTGGAACRPKRPGIDNRRRASAIATLWRRSRRSCAARSSAWSRPPATAMSSRASAPPTCSPRSTSPNLRLDPSDPAWPDRDRLLLSTAHNTAIFYATLAARGCIAADALATYTQDGSPLEVNASERIGPAIEATCGSLGQGLSVARRHGALRPSARPRRSRLCDPRRRRNAGGSGLGGGDGGRKPSPIQSLPHPRRQQDAGRRACRFRRRHEPDRRQVASFGFRVEAIDGNDIGAIARRARAGRATSRRVRPASSPARSSARARPSSKASSATRCACRPNSRGAPCDELSGDAAMSDSDRRERQSLRFHRPRRFGRAAAPLWRRAGRSGAARLAHRLSFAPICAAPPRPIVSPRKCRTRHVEAGIAEANMIGMAAGMARCGDMPFVHSFSVFVTRRCFDQIAMQVAYPKLPVKIVGFLPGLTTALGVSHQAIDDIALMRALPNMTVIEPSGPSNWPRRSRRRSPSTAPSISE